VKPVSDHDGRSDCHLPVSRNASIALEIATGTGSVSVWRRIQFHLDHYTVLGNRGLQMKECEQDRSSINSVVDNRERCIVCSHDWSSWTLPDWRRKTRHMSAYLNTLMCSALQLDTTA